jgi:hypothetical protein
LEDGEGKLMLLARVIGELGLRLDKSISKQRAGERGDEYFVRFPTASSPKRFLEWHLRKGRDSDVDLLVIMPTRNPLDQALKIRLAIPARFPLELLVRMMGQTIGFGGDGV